MSTADDGRHALTQLGRQIAPPNNPEEAVLERVPAPYPDKRYMVRFTAPEFTSLCPITGQPDFAHIVLDYVPDKWIVESKSLKLFLTSFRNHGAFHEPAPYKSPAHWLICLTPYGFGLALTGTHAAGFRLMSSGRQEMPRQAYGFLRRMCPIIKAVVKKNGHKKSHLKGGFSLT